MPVDRSRSLALAKLVSDQRSDLERHLDAVEIVVSVDDEVPVGRLTARTLLTTLRRGLGHLILITDGLPAPFVDELSAALADIDPDRPMTTVRGSDLTESHAIRVHIGTEATGNAIRIVPEGFGAHVASHASASIRPRRPGNAIGGIYTAALGASEVFKRAAAVRPERRVLHRHLRFCPFDLSADLSAAPDLPAHLEFHFTLVGVGAIGTGIVLTLGALDAGGEILAVDRQRFDPENVGTYSIGGAADGLDRPWKVDLAARHLPGFGVSPQGIDAAAVIKAIDEGALPWHRTVLTALDSPEARRVAQRLWPDRLIDAQTGDTMVGVCDHRHGIDSCLQCIFRVDRNQPSGVEALAQELGLPPERLADGESLLTEHDLNGLTVEQEDRLRPYVGTPICGLASATGLSRLSADGFMPSVPFVSLQAACLSVARLIQSHLGLAPSANFVQYDALFGPQNASLEFMKRRADCTCAERAATIQTLRVRRSGHR